MSGQPDGGADATSSTEAGAGAVAVVSGAVVVGGEVVVATVGVVGADGTVESVLTSTVVVVGAVADAVAVDDASVGVASAPAPNAVASAYPTIRIASAHVRRIGGILPRRASPCPRVRSLAPSIIARW
jgi:hypothetical protein